MIKKKKRIGSFHFTRTSAQGHSTARRSHRGRKIRKQARASKICAPLSRDHSLATTHSRPLTHHSLTHHSLTHPLTHSPLTQPLTLSHSPLTHSPLTHSPLTHDHSRRSLHSHHRALSSRSSPRVGAAPAAPASAAVVGGRRVLHCCAHGRARRALHAPWSRAHELRRPDRFRCRRRQRRRPRRR